MLPQSPKKERLRFLPLLELELDEWTQRELHLLADALRLVNSSATAPAVCKEIDELLSQLWALCAQQRLPALRLALRLLRSSSTLAAAFALEVVHLASVDLWLLSPEERLELSTQARRMCAEPAWLTRAQGVLRQLHQQDHLARHCSMLPHSQSATVLTASERPAEEEVSRPQTLQLKTLSRQEREFMPSEKPRAHPRCFDSMQVMKHRRGWLREYPDLNVTAPQNCQTVALRVPPDRSADAIGSIVEEMVSSKKGRTEVSGMLVEDSTGARALLRPEDLGTFTALSSCHVEQCQRFVFPHSLSALGRALLEIYDEVEAIDGSLRVCNCVHVALDNQVLSIHWESSPVNDLVADSVSLTAIELTRSPSMLTALRGTDTGKEEERIFKVLRTYLEQEFGRLSVDVKKMVLSFEVDGNTVTVNFPSRLVECQEEALSQRVRTALRRCERSLRPIPAF
ncbi:unnamed protein product [Effrenium voratum]|uniref:Pre-mRNA 3'-end-processing endonuclease polyadenylation factor C-term domain-containing protein n=1 Tax=Effrenium voratum TaxID=2562239 RepID=A0AA36JIT8_9DINO|nr:unnamed protein product [Effrenium voratum]